MTSTPETIQSLNTVLKYALTGINQYFLHARMLKHQGQMKLADYEYRHSLGAMKYADMLVDHILSLGGSPNMQDLNLIRVGETSGQMLTFDLELAEGAIAAIDAAVASCGKDKNQSSLDLLSKILASQQEHRDFIRSQLTISQAA